MEKLPTIYLEERYHRDSAKIFIKFTYNKKLVDFIKTIRGMYWSATLKSWYIKKSKENLLLIYDSFDGLTSINDDKLNRNTKQQRVLTDEQKLLLNNFYMYLKGKRYSKSTLKTYTFYVADFIDFHSKKNLEELNNRSVEEFIEVIFIKRNYSISSQRQFISALKIFINYYPNTQINNLELVRPKKSKKLPSVLSQEEVVQILQVTKNLKHRAVLALIYSCGLRISELINLKLKDINIERKQLLVTEGKGRKDRYVSLADSFLPLFSNYFNSYQPKYYFVEGKDNHKYSAESVRQFLKKSCKQAKILKNVTPHTLRHSYATHLLENGVDIRYIQSLLGHARPETTMIYTHVKRKDLMQINNPLDMALQKIKDADKTNNNLLLSRNNI